MGPFSVVETSVTEIVVTSREDARRKRIFLGGLKTHFG